MALELPYIEKFPLDTELSVYLVDGPWVRLHYNMDFNAGGHDLVYDFIPRKQIWIDSSIERAERPFALLHELHERKLIETQGLSYNDAHTQANELEHTFRKNSSGLTEEITKLLQPYY